MKTQEVINLLQSKYPCKEHPEDKNAVVIYNITLSEFQKICKKYGCSGHYNEEERIAVATNFGFYIKFAFEK